MMTAEQPISRREVPWTATRRVTVTVGLVILTVPPARFTLPHTSSSGTEPTMPETVTSFGMESSRDRLSRRWRRGLYEISGFTLSRAGWWNIALSVQTSSTRDSLAFNLILPRS